MYSPLAFTGSRGRLEGALLWPAVLLETLKLFSPGLVIRTKVLPADHWLIDATECSLGACLIELGRLEEAEKLLPPAYERLCGSLGREHRITRSLRRAVCELFEKLKRPEEAAKYCPPGEESSGDPGEPEESAPKD